MFFGQSDLGARRDPGSTTGQWRELNRFALSSYQIRCWSGYLLNVSELSVKPLCIYSCNERIFNISSRPAPESCVAWLHSFPRQQKKAKVPTSALDVPPVFFETVPFKYVKIDSTELGEERPMSTHKVQMAIGIKKGVTILIFIGLFLLVLCVVLGFFVTKHLPKDDDGSGAAKSTGPVCLSTACLRVAARIQENMSPDIDPCDNFAAFACGNYKADRKLSPGVPPLQVHDDLASIALLKSRRVLEAPVRRKTKESAERKVKDLFASCVSHSESESYKFSALKRVLYRIGGWDGSYDFLDFRDPVTMNTWDLDNAMKTAYFDLGLEPIFRFHIEDLVYGDVPAQLKIFPIDFYSCVEIDDNFRTYMRKLALLFNDRDNGKYFTSSVQKIFEKFCKDAALEDEFFIEETVTTPANLSQIIPNSIDWIGFLTQHYKIHANTKIYVINLHKKMALLKDLASLDPSAVRNFFALKLIETYIAAMPKNIIDVYFEYQNKTGNLEETFPLKTGWRSCLKDNINEAMTLALLAEMEKYSEKPVITNQRLEELGESVRHAGMNRMASLRYLDSKVKRIIWNRLNDKVMVLGGPKWVTCDEKLDKFYEHLDVNRSDPYLVNLVNARSFTGKIKATKMNLKDPNIWLFFVRYADAVKAAAFSIPSNNGLAILNSMMREPFYNDDWPMYLNYGGIGSLIGHEYGHDFDGEVYWMNASRLSTMDDMVKCLRNYYPKVDYKGFKLENSSSIARLTQIQVMSDVLGVKWSWEAYKKEVKRSQQAELRLPGIDYTPEQLFFINLAQTWCFQDNVNQTNFKYGARSLIFFSQSEFMPKVFNCPVGSTMNPKQQCHIW